MHPLFVGDDPVDRAGRGVFPVHAGIEKPRNALSTLTTLFVHGIVKPTDQLLPS